MYLNWVNQLLVWVEVGFFLVILRLPCGYRSRQFWYLLSSIAPRYNEIEYFFLELEFPLLHTTDTGSRLMGLSIEPIHPMNNWCK